MRYKTCSVCRRDKPETDYIKGNTPFLPEGTSIICLSCLEKMIPATDLQKVDELMRWLDLPFYVDQWTALHKTKGQGTLTAYAALVSGNPAVYLQSKGSDGTVRQVHWADINEKWLKAQERSRLHLEVAELSAEWLAEMKRKWPGNYTRDEYLSLEEFYEGMMASFPMSTETQRREARQMCMMSKVVDKKIEAGVDASKDIKAYLELKKGGGFEAENAKNVADFDSLSELIVWMGKKGFQPSFANEKKDVVDMTIHNTQEYLRRIVMNEPSLSDQVDQRMRSYELAKKMEDGDGLPTFEETAPMMTELEGGEELNTELGDFYG